MILLSCQEDALTGFTLWAVLAVAGLSNFALSALAFVGSYLGVSLFSSCGARVHGIVGEQGESLSPTTLSRSELRFQPRVHVNQRACQGHAAHPNHCTG